MVRASGCDPGGSEFDPRPSTQRKYDAPVAQRTRASGYLNNPKTKPILTHKWYEQLQGLVMAYKKEVIELSRKMRNEGASLGRIVQAVGASKATVYSWIKDMPIPIIDGENIRDKARRENGLNSKGRDTQWKWREKREVAYSKGWEEADKILKDENLRDFVCIYIGEGHRRSKNSVAVTNTDPVIISLCERYLRRYSNKKLAVRLWCEESEFPELSRFWSEHLGIPLGEVRFQEKKQVSKRRAKYGIVSVCVNDTAFRNRLQGWIDKVKSNWVVRPTG